MITITRKKKKVVPVIAPEQDIAINFTEDYTVTQKLAKAKECIFSYYSEEKATKICSLVDTLPSYEARLEVYRDVLKSIAGSLSVGDIVDNHFRYRITPVSPEVFLLDEYYLGMRGSVYDVVLESYVELNTFGKYNEAVLTGSIGCGKTTIALWTTAYQLYLLSCLRNPQKEFHLDKSSEIIFIFQSLNAKLSKVLDFARFKILIEKSRYFQDNFSHDRGILSELRFPNNIIVKPVSGSESGAIGQNVIGGVIDELNFMAYIENSKSSKDGGVYDQAIALYNSISRRRKSRFMTKGGLPGMLCLVSSKRYPGQFTDNKMAEADVEILEKGSSSIFVYDKTTWDVLPADRFSGEWFLLFIGDSNHKPRVLEEGEPVLPYMRDKVMEVPVEYRIEFESDIMGSLRDIAGVTTLAKHPFLVDTDKVVDCFRKDIVPVVSRDLVDFYKTTLEIYPDLFINPTIPRWCHIDLGVTGDHAGIVIGHCSGFTKVIRSVGLAETLPNIYIDIAMSVAPPRGGEINFAKIRALLYKLRLLGLNLRWTTTDSFQSVDMKQLLAHKGFLTGTISTDTTLMPYSTLKTALYDGRVFIPEQPKLQTELISLEFHAKKNKVDHPPHGSKDIADALASVVFGLTTRREIWSMYDIPVSEMPTRLEELVKEDHGSAHESAHIKSKKVPKN